MSIQITFACGHTKAATGAEEDVRCACGEYRVERVEAPAPRFRGTVLGPHSQFENLEPKPVSFEVQKNG